MKRHIITLAVVGAVTAALAVPPAYAGIMGRGMGGALSGAMVGKLVGGKRGARTGAIIGGVIGASEAAADMQRHQYHQAEMQRRQAEWAAQQQFEEQRIQRAQAAAAPAQAGDQTLLIETQKSLIRLGFQPGAIGRAGPELTAAVRQYQKSKGLLETGDLSQALLAHMLQNGG
jgi:uncharacterized protein YcfJ